MLEPYDSSNNNIVVTAVHQTKFVTIAKTKNNYKFLNNSCILNLFMFIIYRFRVSTLLISR